jgi:hypothetical protein
MTPARKPDNIETAQPYSLDFYTPSIAIPPLTIDAKAIFWIASHPSDPSHLPLPKTPCYATRLCKKKGEEEENGDMKP